MSHPYVKQMAWFILFLGTSSVFGALGHAIQMRWGDNFFKVVFFLMNALSLLAIYFCFRSSYTYMNLTKKLSEFYVYAVMFWVFVLLVISGVRGNFLLIKIHAFIVLLFASIVHFIVYRRTGERGSMLVVFGILISFLSILVHSIKFSIDEWFNYKDIAHVIMIVSLITIFKGVSEIAIGLSQSVRSDSAT
jgi:hypothetical protein